MELDAYVHVSTAKMVRVAKCGDLENRGAYSSPWPGAACLSVTPIENAGRPGATRTRTIQAPPHDPDFSSSGTAFGICRSRVLGSLRQCRRLSDSPGHCEKLKPGLIASGAIPSSRRQGNAYPLPQRAIPA